MNDVLLLFNFGKEHVIRNLLRKKYFASELAEKNKFEGGTRILETKNAIMLSSIACLSGSFL